MTWPGRRIAVVTWIEDVGGSQPTRAVDRLRSGARSGRAEHAHGVSPLATRQPSPTMREVEAKKIDEGDYRGTAGSAYFDLDGDKQGLYKDQKILRRKS